MSARMILVAGARDAALVLVTTMVAFLLVAMAPSLELASELTSAETHRLAGDAPNASDVSRSSPDAPFSRASVPGHELAAVGLPRDAGRSSGAIVENAAAAPPFERFSGEGAGRKRAVVARDPYNRRAYLLESASLLQRRGWIGLASDVRTSAPGDSGGPRLSEAYLGPE